MDVETGEQYNECTLADIKTAFTLLEIKLSNKINKLNDTCRTFFDRFEACQKEQDT